MGISAYFTHNGLNHRFIYYSSDIKDFYLPFYLRWEFVNIMTVLLPNL